MLAKRTSRLVRMPTSLPVVRPPPPPLATTGMPEMRLAFISASASASVASGPMVIGLTTMPLSNDFTCRTSSACSSGVRLRWMTPRPPACAMAIAIWCSVTVSIAADRIGRLSSMSLVTRQRMSTSVGSTSERAGCSSTSSKVSAASPVMEVTILAKALPFQGDGKTEARSGRLGRAAGWRGSLAPAHEVGKRHVGRAEKAERSAQTPVSC